MKKIILLIVIIITIATSAQAQKVNFNLQNGRVEAGNLVVDVYATVNAGQTWAVGLTNIRMHFYSIPPGAVTVIPDNPVTNANTNLSNNANYFNMSSNAIMSDTAISLNIFLQYGKTAYVLNPGSYWLGSIRFVLNNTSSCIVLGFLNNSAVFNSSTPLVYGTDWTFTDPAPCIISGVSNNNTREIPSSYKLSQNYPNPFNPTTAIEYSIPKNGLVTLRVFDILGRQVAELVNQVKTAGTYLVDFNGSELSSGMYFYRLEVNDYVSVKRMVLVK